MSISFANPIASGVEDGIEWLTKAAPIFGGVNGYVMLPEGHPWLTLNLQWTDYEVVDVHGGITYGPDEEGRIGFDTLHAGDIWPGTPSELGGRQWTPELVAEETKRLARQAAAALVVAP